MRHASRAGSKSKQSVHNQRRTWKRKLRALSLILAAAGLGSLDSARNAEAASMFWTGAGNWNTTNTNWGTVTGGPYTSAWVTGSDAVFEGTAGIVSLTATNPTAHNLTFNVTG